MALKRFVDVSVGTKFVLDGTEYIKITEERISCCKALNAAMSSNPNNKIQVIPITEVEVQE